MGRTWTVAVSGMIVSTGRCLLTGAYGGTNSDKILDLLVDKELITEQDAEALRLELGRTKSTDFGVGYKEGTYIHTQGGEHALHVRFLLQPQFEHLDVGGGESTDRFKITRAQLRLFGHVLDPRLQYKMMVMGATQSDSGTMELRDLWVDWQGSGAFQIKVGQFFVYFDYEDIAPTWAQPLVDRSIINSQLGFERDLGVQLHGHLFSDRVQDYLHTMNGDGRNEMNEGNDLMHGARVDVHLLGKHQYMLPDLDPSEDPHLAWGSAFLDDTGNASVGTNRLNRFTTDLTFRYRGFSALGLVNWARNEDKGETDFGVLGQAGYFVVPERIEVVGRWAEIDQNGALGGALADPGEATIGLNYYFHAHQVKLQADYSRLSNTKSNEGQDDDRIRVQLQLFF